LTVIRPTAALFTIAGLIFALWLFRARSSAFVIALAVGAAPGVAWNAYFFHSLLGGYSGIAPMSTVYVPTPHHVVSALTGLLISPSRGILAFSPVLVFAPVGAIRAWRIRDRHAVLILALACACCALIAQYAIFAYWWAGFTYGPRYFCDTLGVAGLLLLYVIPPNPIAYARRNAATGVTAGAFALLLSYSVAVQFVGANSGAAGSEWNAVPISVDRDPDRVWPIADNQIERNMRAAYFRFFAWNIARLPDYERGIAARVTGLSPSLARVAPGASIDVTAALSNDGRSPIYGYDSGVYTGQMRIDVRILDAAAQLSSEQYLYVKGSPAPGGRATVLGTLAMPSRSGTYVLELNPVLVGGGSMRQRAAPLRVVVVVI
jgi:hypothetical protein